MNQKPPSGHRFGPPPGANIESTPETRRLNADVAARLPRWREIELQMAHKRMLADRKKRPPANGMYYVKLKGLWV